MKRVFKTKLLLVMLLLAFPFAVVAQSSGDLPGGGIEPPPTPVDESIIYLFIAAVAFAAFYFYKINFKTEIK